MEDLLTNRHLIWLDEHFPIDTLFNHKFHTNTLLQNMLSIKQVIYFCENKM